MAGVFKPPPPYPVITIKLVPDTCTDYQNYAYICNWVKFELVYKMKQRLEQFLAAENITKAQFADNIKVARAAVSHIIAGRNNPGYEFIVNTISAYPQLNIEWLLTGEGKMYKSPTVGQEEDATIFTNTLDEQRYSTLIEGNTPKLKKQHKVKKIFVLYEDGTYGEFC